MPQGRRKVPFSGKAKKLQMQAKRQRKATALLRTEKESEEGGDDNQSVNVIGGQSMSKQSRYALQFYKESDAEIRKRKELARHGLEPAGESGLEINIQDYFPPDLDFPTRPPWDFHMSRDQLNSREQRYFSDYVKSLEEKYERSELSYFELNLETWRQLWRVLEMSDIVLLIVDIRYPALMFPPSLYNYVIKVMKKDMIVVLNKIDLAPAPLVVAWKHYFTENYPSLKVVCFTSYPGYNLRGAQTNKAGLQIRRRRGKIRMAAEGAQNLLEACKQLVGNEFDLSSWNAKILSELETEYESDDLEIEETIDLKKVDTSFVEYERYKGGTLTIGCVGQPNVGKSSLMNAIMGKKVVSVSRTPGHTKHFQTIYLTPNVRLCDCPGLVFPSKVSRTFQVLMGSFPIAQLREPFTAIRFLGERLDLPKLLRIQHPENDDEWSPMDICEGWAQKRGFFTARAARPDVSRAANELLRMALDGKICLCLRPPEYCKKKEFWKRHGEVDDILKIQAKSQVENIHEESESDSDLGEDPKPSGQHNRARDTASEEESGREEGEEEEEEDELQAGYSNKFSALQNDGDD